MNASAPAEYTIRLFEPSDSREFIDLYNGVFDQNESEKWFQWKYLNNPYTDHIPIFIAEQNGAIAGARPYLVFRLVVGDRVVLGLQTGDTMVHPDHRRRGLFAQMTKRSFSYYCGISDPVVTFNIPNDISRPGYLNLGCVRVGQLPVAYRIQNPTKLFRAVENPNHVDRIGSKLSDLYLSVVDDFAPIPESVTVKRHHSIPISTFVSLYKQRIPDRIHALRDERYFRWRFENPVWDYSAFTVHKETSPIAGAIVGEKEHDGKKTVFLTEILPLEVVRDGIEYQAILATVINLYRDADIIALAKGIIDPGILKRYGFFADDSLPLSQFATPTILIAGFLSPGGDIHSLFNDIDLRDIKNWQLSLGERNTS